MRVKPTCPNLRMAALRLLVFTGIIAIASLSSWRGSFLQSSITRPAIVLDAIAGNDSAGAIAPVLTVDEHRPRKRLNQFERRAHLLPGGAPQTSERKVGVKNAVLPGFGRFGFPNLLWHSQVDDRLDAKLLEIPDSGGIWLGAAIYAIIDLSEVENALLCRQAALATNADIVESQETKGHDSDCHKQQP